MEEDRIPERVRLAVTGLVNNGCLIFREGWLRTLKFPFFPIFPIYGVLWEPKFPHFSPLPL